MARTKVTIKSRGMAELLKSGEVRADLTNRMEGALQAAKASAPYASGDYHDSLHIVQVTTDRAVVRIASGVDYALLVEANYGTLARALDMAGSDLVEYVTRSGKRRLASRAQVAHWTGGRS